MDTVIIDTREHARAIKRILTTFDSFDIPHVSSKLYVGDYQLVSNGTNVVDRKQNLLELANNLGTDLKRFRAELERAKSAGVHITILCEHGYGILCLDDVLGWDNPRLKESPLALSGERLYKKMRALSDGYGVSWQFCSKSETGVRILDILGVPH